MHTRIVAKAALRRMPKLVGIQETKVRRLYRRREVVSEEDRNIGSHLVEA